jgi:hypothetical protein
MKRMAELLDVFTEELTGIKLTASLIVYSPLTQNVHNQIFIL